MNRSQPEFLDQPFPQGWVEAEAALRAAPMLAPAPGFARRWQLRLAASRVRRANRQDSFSLALALGGALAALAVWAMLGPLGSPADLAVQLALRAAAWGLRLELAVGLLEALLGSLPLVVRGLGGLFMLSSAGWLSTLWLASIYRLSFRTIRNGG